MQEQALVCDHSKKAIISKNFSLYKVFLFLDNSNESHWAILSRVQGVAMSVDETLVCDHLVVVLLNPK